MTTSEVKERATQAVQRQSQSNQVVKTDDKVQEVKAMLQKMQPQLKASLVKQINPAYVISTALTAIRQNPTLMECTAVSLIGAIIQSNQLGLRLDGPLGHAYMVPYFNKKKNVMEAQFMPGYRGYLDLARRSGEIAVISSGAVFEKDGFNFEHGLEECLVHKPLLYGDRGKVTHVYAYAKLKNGSFLFDVMRHEDVERIRSRSKAKDSGPWVSDWDEMAKKTVIRRLSKLLPMSVEFAKAAELDELAARGVSQSIQVDTETGDLVHATYEEEAEEKVLPVAVEAPAKVEEPAVKVDTPGDAQEPPEIGVKESARLLADLQGAKTVEGLAAVIADIVKKSETGEITDPQKEDLRAAFKVKHAELAVPKKTNGGGK